jgi:cation:H+ antiporter
MLPDILFVLAGFALLIWGADRFVSGGVALANILGVPPLLIGLTIVGFATSAPELMVSASAASRGLTGMALGNAIGSNIANIGLVLGISVILRPVRGELSAALSKELPLLVLLTPATILLFLDDHIDRIDAGILLIAMAAFMGWMIRLGLRHSEIADEFAAEVSEEIPRAMSVSSACLWLAVGLMALLLGSQLLVNGAESLARAFGVSDLIIGLTVIAIGTSLPEMAVSIVGAVKGETGIAVGNVIGSNVFNLLAVIGVAGLIGPSALDPSIVTLHYPVMIAFTVPLLLIAYNPFGSNGLGRTFGFLLVAAFFAYQAVLIESV